MNGSVERYQTNAGMRWRIRYELPPGPDGGRRNTSRRGFTRERDAQRALREVLGRVEAGTHVGHTRVTVGEYLRGWLDGIRVRPNTEAQYRMVAERYVIPRVGGVRLQALSADQLDVAYRELERKGGRTGGPLSPKTVRHVHTMTRRALRDAVERGYVPRNVADLAHPPTQRQAKSKVSRDRVWTAEQIRAFLTAAQDDLLHPCFHLIASTGLRRGEACGLAWADVDFHAATLRVRDAKTDAGERSIAFDAGTVRVLRDWKGRQLEHRMAAGSGWHDSGAVFTDEIGRPVKADRVYRRLVALADTASLPRLDVHGLRHSYATAALRAGVPVHVVSARLGHATPSITLDVYSHVLGGDDHAAAEATAAAIFGGLL